MNESTKLGAEFVSGASKYGPEVWLASVVLGMVAVVVVLYVWKIAIPNATAHREATGMLAQSVAQSTGVVGDTNDRVVVIGGDASAIKKMVASLAKSREVECVVIEKLAEAIDVDVGPELGRIRGQIESIRTDK